MKFIEGQNREQLVLIPTSLDALIDSNNEGHTIDLFVDGTNKRQWNFHFILTKKGMERAASDVGFIFVAYNLRRLMNLIDKKELLKYLKGMAKLYSAQMGFIRCHIRTLNFNTVEWVFQKQAA